MDCFRDLAVKRTDAVAQFIIAVTRKVPQDVSREEIELNGAPGLVLLAGGRAVLAILIDTDGERIHSVFAVANPEKLESLAVRGARRSARAATTPSPPSAG